MTPAPIHKESIAKLHDLGVGKPDISIILGSGLGRFTRHIENPLVIPYTEIPQLPKTSVAGHEGALYYGRVGEKRVLTWAGRFHYYEGYPFEKTILPVQLTHALGCNSLIVTNAAGGINHRFEVGDLMLIDDILSPFISVSPSQQPLFERFSNDDTVINITRIAAQIGIHVTRGCYMFAEGPTYETKAEVRAFRKMGADAVGMSTAAELYEAVRLKMSYLGISLITNKATGVSKATLDHSEIKEAAKMREKEFIALITKIITDSESPLCN